MADAKQLIESQIKQPVREASDESSTGIAVDFRGELGVMDWASAKKFASELTALVKKHTIMGYDGSWDVFGQEIDMDSGDNVGPKKKLA